MPSRPASGRAGLRATINIDVALLAPSGGRLVVFAPQEERGRRALPSGAPRAGESLENAAARIARGALGSAIAWLEQVVTRMDGESATVLFAGLVAAPEAGDDAWIPRERTATLGAGVRRQVDDAATAAGIWLDRTPIAFRLLPGSFTLSELQEVYEAVLGQPLDRRNFRKRIMALDLIEDLHEMETDVPHRPGKLYRLKK